MPTSRRRLNEMSTLLLQGWCMLADSCPQPGCHVPLLRSKDGRIYCTSCKIYCVRESDAQGPKYNISSAATGAGGGAGADGDTTTAAAAAAGPSATPAPAPAPAPAASAESPAEQRDEEEAAVTASSSSLEDKGASLVDAEQDYDDDDGWTPPTAEEMEEINRRRAHSDACSKKVGELLLKRWKMLNAMCVDPNCPTPLMQNPADQRNLCVSCNRYLVKAAPGEYTFEDEAGTPSASTAAPSAPSSPGSPQRSSGLDAGSTGGASAAAGGAPSAGGAAAGRGAREAAAAGARGTASTTPRTHGDSLRRMHMTKEGVNSVELAAALDKAAQQQHPFEVMEEDTGTTGASAGSGGSNALGHPPLSTSMRRGVGLLSRNGTIPPPPYPSPAASRAQSRSASPDHMSTTRRNLAAVAESFESAPGGVSTVATKRVPLSRTVITNAPENWYNMSADELAAFAQAASGVATNGTRRGRSAPREGGAQEATATTAAPPTSPSWRSGRGGSPSAGGAGAGAGAGSSASGANTTNARRIPTGARPTVRMGTTSPSPLGRGSSAGASASPPQSSHGTVAMPPSPPPPPAAAADHVTSSAASVGHTTLSLPAHRSGARTSHSGSSLVASRTPMRLAPTPTGAAGSVVSTGAVTSRTVEVLYSKLSSATAALESCNDIDGCRRIAELIEQLGRTINLFV